MDKLLCVFGMGLFVGFIKVRAWLDGFAGMVNGTDGFVLMMGICAAALLCAGVIILIGNKRKTA